MRTQKHPVLAIVGPTGSGKSDLALYMAGHFGGEIVNCDSVQVYSGFNIGSAKTPAGERQGIPHHVLDVVEGWDNLTAGDYARLARAAILGILGRERLPIVVGGTGLYLRALFDGLSPAPPRDPLLRQRLVQLQARHPLALHRFLRRFDRRTADRIHSNDRQKLIRAVELVILGGQSAGAMEGSPRDRFGSAQVIKIGLNPDRRELYARLDVRSANLFQSGLLEETETLLASGVPPSAKPLGSLGYKQALDLLAGRISQDEAVRVCQTKTRQYAKRQLTWFRHEPDVHWLSGFGADKAIQAEAAQFWQSVIASQRPADSGPA